ncbi:tRNA pseudouridine(13) synthase TruD [Candidatus Woesearchaeota archaeon]|nr:tRNA pseudouridine(13) synthase TruD [Candidatus Woesearchaeota archaeon]
MYKIKQVPEDFVVREKSRIELSDNGEFSYFTLRKRNYTTLRAVQAVANALKIAPKFVGFAGTKDKNAVTEQSISIKSIKKEELKLKDINLEFIGYGDKPLSLGDLEGNSFEIVVRNLDSFDDFKERDKFINLFGEQRFSSNNAGIGKAIIRKDFKKAIELILVDERDYKPVIEEHLEKNQNDYVGALQKLPKKMVSMYTHAYQSLLWNQTALGLKDNAENIKVPIVGFGTEVDEIKNQKLKSMINEIINKEKIKPRDFIIRELQGLSPEGTERDLFAEIKDLKIMEKSDDELNKGKKKIKLSFFLRKGCYATEAVKALFHQA